MTASQRRSFQRGEVGVAVADELLDLGKEMGVGAAAVEEGDLVAAGARVAHDVGADEAGAAEDEDGHALLAGSAGPGWTVARGRLRRRVCVASGAGPGRCRPRRPEAKCRGARRDASLPNELAPCLHSWLLRVGSRCVKPWSASHTIPPPTGFAYLCCRVNRPVVID